MPKSMTISHTVTGNGNLILERELANKLDLSALTAITDHVTKKDYSFSLKPELKWNLHKYTK